MSSFMLLYVAKRRCCREQKGTACLRTQFQNYPLATHGTGTLLMNDNCAKSFAFVIEIISSYVMAVDYHHHHYSHHSHHQFYHQL